MKGINLSLSYEKRIKYDGFFVFSHVKKMFATKYECVTFVLKLVFKWSVLTVIFCKCMMEQSEICKEG